MSSTLCTVTVDVGGTDQVADASLGIGARSAPHPTRTPPHQVQIIQSLSEVGIVMYRSVNHNFSLRFALLSFFTGGARPGAQQQDTSKVCSFYSS
jgi:hypothetical protein